MMLFAVYPVVSGTIEEWIHNFAKVSYFFEMFKLKGLLKKRAKVNECINHEMISI